MIRRVAVVGAGVVGCAIARELAMRGAEVVLIDQREPMGEATADTFGWLSNQTTFRNAADFTGDRAYEYFRLSRMAIAEWRRLEASVGWVGIRWNGMLAWSGTAPEEMAEAEAEVDRRQRWGSATRRITRQEVEKRLGFTPQNFGTGYLVDDEGHIDPRVAVAVLAGAALDAGAKPWWPAKVERISPRGGKGWSVETSRGAVLCDAVVVAAGIASPGLVQDFGIPVPLTSSRGSLVHLESIPMFLGPVLQSPVVHALQRPDGRVILAEHYSGTTVGETEGPPDPQLILDRSAAMMPQLREARVSRVTTGSRVLPDDGFPIVGRSSEDDTIVSVTTNAGITLAPLLARLVVTELLTGKQQQLLDSYRSDRFAASAAQ